MLEEKQEYQTTVLPDGQLQVKQINIILKDGVEISRSNHRYVIDVGDDVSNEDSSVQVIANAVHTKEKIKARKAAKGEK